MNDDDDNIGILGKFESLSIKKYIFFKMAYLLS